MEIITSHTNADFDALASMVAAKKLYPDARIVFAGSQERTMREFFLESAAYAVAFDRLRNIDVERITKLIVVDNRSPQRLGKLAEAAGRPGVTVHVYDHHPAAAGDMRGDLEVVDEVGATTTLMIEQLISRGIAVAPVEATVLALGIYEETGSLTYVSTTPRDVRAAAWAVEQGADLSVVSDFISRELTPEQTAVLAELMKEAASYDINGVRVVIAALATQHYLPDLAALAHRIRDREHLDVLFLVVQMGEKTQIIGRSRLPHVGVGKVLEPFGGGGHRTAASAVAKDMTYLQARERLISELKQHITPGRTAADIMTSPVKTIASGRTVREAGEDMTRFSVNVLPVVAADRLLGIITREEVQKALFHDLGGSSVDAFMSTGIISVGPDLSLHQIERIMIGERQRFLPVIDGAGGLAGAITRTDLLRSLHEERFPRQGAAADAGDAQLRNVRGFMEERLPHYVRDTLRAVGELADETGYPVYLVGGIVRDLFLRVQNPDVDLVVEGDGITFAGMVVRRLGGRMRTHAKFGTAVIILPDGLKLDIATARLEYYESPASLPTIELSSIKKDLYRRDFTINTLAIRLNRKHYGELIDFFGGLRDVKERNIRILHNLSFVEDPTRVFRAIRFEQRFQFQISKHTQNLIKNAVGLKLFTRLSGDRIYDELVLMFSEADPVRVMRRMQEFDLLCSIHPALRFSAELERLFTSIGETLVWHRMLYLDVRTERWYLYLLALLDRVKDPSAAAVLDRLSVPARLRKRVQTARERGREVLFELYRAAEPPPSRIHKLLSPLDVEEVLFLMAKTRKESARKCISLYLTRLRGTKVAITGEDLKRLGIPPGPRYRKVLDALLEARLDGKVTTPEEELVFARSAAGS